MHKYYVLQASITSILTSLVALLVLLDIIVLRLIQQERLFAHLALIDSYLLQQQQFVQLELTAQERVLKA